MTLAPPPALPKSLWAATAVADQDWPVLSGAVRAEVAIVGGGITAATPTGAW